MINNKLLVFVLYMLISFNALHTSDSDNNSGMDLNSCIEFCTPKTLQYHLENGDITHHYTNQGTTRNVTYTNIEDEFFRIPIATEPTQPETFYDVLHKVNCHEKQKSVTTFLEQTFGTLSEEEKNLLELQPKKSDEQPLSEQDIEQPLSEQDILTMYIEIFYNNK